MHFETKAIHSGAQTDEETGAIAPPIHLSTTFERSLDGGALRGFSYVRDGNPTQARLEEALAAIDSGESALAFASGIGAAAAVLQTLPSGAHVLLPDDSYYAMRTIARDFFPKWQLTSTIVAMDDLDAVRAAMRDETRLIWAESPSNPLLKICDLRALAAIAHERGAQLAVDGTFATPALQRPIELGADLVIHSSTKYLGGHSDVAGGAVVFKWRTGNPACPGSPETGNPACPGSAETGNPAGQGKPDRQDCLSYNAVAHVRENLGATAAPFNSWLVLRGIRTLAARMRVHSANAMAVATFLESHPRVEVVHYPGLASHPGHEIAKRQMSDFGGMLSFLVKGGREEALAVAARTKIFVRATSLGAIESLIEHRASSEGAGSRTAQNLLRLSVGLEHVEDLIEDLSSTLEAP
jgi:cystathionine gamma-synthase